MKYPHQEVGSQKTRKRNKACFDVEICERCPLSGGCPSLEGGRGRTFYYFERSDFHLSRRSRNRGALPVGQRGLRANVEATVKEFTKPFNHKGKLGVRGLFKTMVYAFSMAMLINFGRVWRYVTESPDVFFTVTFNLRLVNQFTWQVQIPYTSRSVIRREISCYLCARRLTQSRVLDSISIHLAEEQVFELARGIDGMTSSGSVLEAETSRVAGCGVIWRTHSLVSLTQEVSDS